MNKILKNLKNLNKKTLLISFLLIALTGFVLLQFTRSEEISTGPVEEYTEPLEPGSELKYYLDITYEGVDREGTQASDKTLAKVYSDYIYVEDELPKGLEFVRFEVGDVPQVTAQPVGTSSELCSGFVVNDSGSTTSESNRLGLHYDSETRKVTFKVKELQGGCHLKVGIVTKLPDTVDDPETAIKEKIRHFYNDATAREKVTKKSNTVHAFIRDDTVDEYEVTYEYIGEYPNEALEQLPSPEMHAVGETVGIKGSPKVEGYIFSGWEAVGITKGAKEFEMPEGNVKFIGSFTAIDKYEVRYEIEGEKPESYDVPGVMSYYPGKDVTVDSLEVGKEIEGYRFVGWTIKDAEGNTITPDENRIFQMPESDVVITGKFEKIKYPVTYEFQGVVPEGITAPEGAEYEPGASVTLPVMNNVTGSDGIVYRFLGWDKDDGFTMPSEAVVVYGEWEINKGKFSPTIQKEIVNKKDYYKKGEKVLFDITVTNTANYEIKNVQVRENIQGRDATSESNAYFVIEEGSNITKLTNKLVEIPSIPALGSVTLRAEYIVTENDIGTLTNEVEVIAAQAENNELTKDRPKDSKEFNIQSRLNICKTISEKTNNNVFQFKINDNVNFETYIRIENNGEKACQTLYLDPGTYNISEILTQEYSIGSIEVSENLRNTDIRNGKEVNIELGEQYEITFNNTYRGKGFFRTFGSIINKIAGKE